MDEISDTPEELKIPGNPINYTEAQIKAGTRPSGFKKFDVDKIDLTLVPPELETAVGRVMTFGAKKYGRDNWQLCDNPNDYMAAVKRHLNAIARGEDIDPETGFLHLEHVACNVAFLLWFKTKEINLDCTPGKEFVKKELTKEERYENL